VLESDPIYADVKDLADLSPTLRRRLEHYFLTYKLIPGQEPPLVSLDRAYGLDEAKRVILTSIEDYGDAFG